MSTLEAERRDPSRCIKYSPCEKIVPSCVSRFILIPVIHDAPRRSRNVGDSSAIYLPFRFRWLCRRNAGGSSRRNARGRRWFVEKSRRRVAGIERLIDGRVTEERGEGVPQLSTSCFTLTRRTRNTFFTLLNI